MCGPEAVLVWIPWLIEIGISVGSLAWLRAEFSSPEESPYRWWWVAAIGAYYAWWVCRFIIRIPAMFRFRRARQKTLVETADRLQAMHRCYAELSGPVLDPTLVRDAMLAATKLGVQWSSATWPLLEGAIMRDPHRWLTSLSRSCAWPFAVCGGAGASDGTGCRGLFRFANILAFRSSSRSAIQLAGKQMVQLL